MPKVHRTKIQQPSREEPPQARSGRGFLHRRKENYEQPTVQSTLHRERQESFSSGTGVGQGIHSQHFCVVSHWRVSTGQPERKKSKTTSICKQHCLTRRQPCKRRKFLSLTSRDTTSCMYFYALIMSNQKVKLRSHGPLRCKRMTLVNKFNPSSVALSVETAHTVDRNEELKARTQASAT